MCFDVPTTASVQRARLEAVFDSPRTLEGWTRQLLKTATHVAALLLEIERCQGRGAGMRSRPDGAAPLIGSSQAIRAVRQRIERVAETDFTVLIEGAIGPEPHRSFIEVSINLPSVEATGRWRERGKMGQTG
jgi:transcriptional regulator with PAS, ATPase and Fis domain